MSYEYDVWGNCTVKDASGNPITSSVHIGNVNPIRYRGYYYDNDLGLYYLQSRYYDATIGRFINVDTIEVLSASFGELTDKNLFAYCDNNPVIRSDNGGEFWHIVAGAVIGAAIGAVSSIVTQKISGQEISWAKVGISAAFGAASGALASTGIGVVGMMVGGAALSMAENAVTQVVENKGFNKFDVSDMIYDGVVGGVSGAIGGSGSGSKHLTNLGKQTLKRTLNAGAHKGLKAGLKEAGKAAVYYGKNTSKHYKDLISGVPRDFVSSLGVWIATSDTVKNKCWQMMGVTK